jgi:hypothetical protein
MTDEQMNTLLEELKDYAQRLNRLGYSPKQYSDLRLNHVYWLCQDVILTLANINMKDIGDRAIPYKIGFLRGALYESKVAYGEDILALPNVTS